MTTLELPQNIVAFPIRTEVPKPNETILVIGNWATWLNSGRTLPEMTGITFADISEITQEFIQAINPQLVLSTLITTTFDVIDVAMNLVSAKFCGRFGVIVDQPIDGDLVALEISQIAPQISIQMLDARLLRSA